MVQRSRQPPVRLIHRGEDIVMFIDGRIDARCQQVVAETVDELLTQPFEALWVDLAGAHDIDDSGVELLCAVRSRALSAGRRLLIRSPSTRVTRHLEEAGMWPQLAQTLTSPTR
jgi:anti-anti-sigma regulatory factor